MENESTFVAPEGVYTLTEEHKAIIVPPNSVVLAQPIHPTKVSSIVIKYAGPKQASSAAFAQLLSGNKDKPPPKERDKDDGISQSSSDTGDDEQNIETALPFSHPPVGTKKKTISRPKHNIRTTSSTFITRVQYAEGPTKALQSRQGEITMLFYNFAKSLLWVEAGSKAKEPLTRITFSAHPTCQDVNTTTACSERLDIIIGFNTGDLVWFDPILARYTRLNKQGSISSSPCTAVRWVPSSPTLFLVSHADGTVLIYDKDRDDGAFTPLEPTATPSSNGEFETQPSSVNGPDTQSSSEWNPMDSVFVTIPPWHPVNGGAPPGKADKDKVAKNPVSHWRVSKRSVVDFVFSPDVKYVAAISEDGCLRVIDALAEQLVDCYASYFGSLTCVAWSPDGRFILTGGQDDLLTLISPWEQRVIARCQGHSSFVSAVAFDDLRCDGRTYRFGSVGEDNKLILWDFSSGALHRPKFQATHQHRGSMASTVSLAFRRDRSVLYLPSPGGGSPGAETSPLPRYHPAPARNQIAVVQPVLIKQIENDLLSVIQFLPRTLLTSTKTGHIKLWIRPLALRPRLKNVHNPID